MDLLGWSRLRIPLKYQTLVAKDRNGWKLHLALLPPRLILSKDKRALENHEHYRGYELNLRSLYLGCPASYQHKNEKKLWQFADKSDIFTKKIRKCPIFYAKSSEEQKKGHYVRRCLIFHAKSSKEQKKDYHVRRSLIFHAKSSQMSIVIWNCRFINKKWLSSKKVINKKWLFFRAIASEKQKKRSSRPQKMKND